MTASLEVGTGPDPLVEGPGGPPVVTAHGTTDEPTGDLGGDVRRGAAWTAVSTILLRFANIALTAVIVRIVSKEEFGIFLAAITVHAIVVSFAELGVSSAVARSDLDPDEIAPTVASIAVVTSLALGIAMLVFAGQIAELMHSPQAAAPLRVLSLTVMMIGPFAVPGAQLQREFKQKWLFKANVVTFVVSSALLLVLARVGDGAMAFAWSRVAGFAVTGVMMAVGVSKWYWPGFNRDHVAMLIRFALPLAAANLLSQVLLNVDYVFVSRLLDSDHLAEYTLAFNIAAWPLAVMSSMLNGVVLPAFSRLKQAGGDLAAALGGATRTVALVACPISALTMALATPLVQTLFGATYLAAAPVLQILSVYGVIFVVCLLYANILIAMGRTGILLLVQVLALAGLVPALTLGIHRAGLVGVGAAHIVIILALTLPVYLVAVRRSTGTRMLSLLGALLPALGTALVAAVLAHLTASVPGPALVKVLLGGLVGGTFYVVAMLPGLLALGPATMRQVGPVSAVADRVEQVWAKVPGVTPRAEGLGGAI